MLRQLQEKLNMKGFTKLPIKKGNFPSCKQPKEVVIKEKMLLPIRHHSNNSSSLV